MSGHEIEASAGLDIGQVLQGLRSMTGELDKATLSMKKLNDQGTKTKSTLQESLKSAGQAAGKAGGPVGSFSSKILTGASMDGIFGRMAVGLGVATLGIRTFSAAVEMAVEKQRLLSQAMERVRQVSDQTDKAIEAKARRGEAQMVGRMAVIAAGGKEGAQQVDNVLATGLVSHDDASRGVASIYGRFGNTARARNATNLAATGAAAGLNFAEVAQQLTKMGAAVDDSSQVERIIGRMLQKQTGRQAQPQDLFKESVGNIYNDPYLRHYQMNNQIRSEIPGSERESFLTTDLARKDLAEGKRPDAKIQEDSNRVQEQQLEDLKALGKAQVEALGGLGRVEAYLEDIATAWGGAGSYNNQYNNAAIARARALGMDPSAPPQSVNPVLGFGSGNFTPFGGGR